jgi:predicted nucleic-acid-binding Zn-ribbon protein
LLNSVIKALYLKKRTDLQVQDNQNFSVASCKSRKVSSSIGRKTTGLGVYCQIQQDNLKGTILLQACKTPSHLYAEALGLLLAIKFAQLIQVNQITFLTPFSCKSCGGSKFFRHSGLLGDKRSYCKYKHE